MKHTGMVNGIVQRICKAAIIMIMSFIIFFMTACNSISDASIIVAGSTSVQPFAEVLAEEYMIIHPDITIDIQGGGSAAGIMAAQSGTAEIGMSSRNLKDEEKGLWFVEIARDGLAVIINPKNPLTDLTLNQIRDIYTAGIVDWSQIGGSKAKIHVIAREEGSGTRTAFEDLVMDKNLITPKAIVQDSNGAVRQLVADDPNAIGFVSLGLVNETVKALVLGGVAATRENVINGSYGLSRPFLFVARTQPSGQTKQFIDFILSPEGQKILATEGLVPSSGGAVK
ncbi:MAG: phosphate ABC transporter substrate-binding protein [Saccharofermentanales bacterium]